MRKRKRTKGISRKALDILWSKHIHSIYNETCAICGSQDRCAAHHVRSRRFNNTRWNLENGILICIRCHFKAHKDYEWFRREYINLHGEKRLNYLWKESQKIVKVDKIFLEKIKEKLEKEAE